MTTFLLVVSFLLHGIMLLVIFVLFARVKKAEELEMRQKQVAGEIEEMFTAYLLEIKEENEQLKQWLDDSQKKHKSPQINQPISNEHGKTAKEETHSDLNKDFSQPVYNPPLPGNNDVEYQPSLSTRVVAMRNDGYTIEDIARKMNCGQTEIELILKFQPQKM
ncbi:MULTISPECIES: DUF6115 domain-containing protein [Thalassobacillus]|uniref:DUF6115 domain-containing protein n=1 Tax=Thalassobacillus TaxID=331971 RepID=UPI00111BE504|nr:hypothetical protein [Thalassobacillus devorans]